MNTEDKDIERDETARSEKVELKFDFLKSNLYRVIHADGAWGGLTPGLNIHMALYSERTSIPNSITFEASPVTGIGKELPEKREAREAIIREVEASIILDLPTAQALVTWLQDKIKQANEVIRRAGQGE